MGVQGDTQIHPQIWRMGEPRQGLGFQVSRVAAALVSLLTHLDRERQSDHPPLAPIPGSK